MDLFLILDNIFFNIINIIKIWWWVLLPCFFYFPAKFFYLWWIQWDVWYNEQQWEFLEIIPPQEIKKPYRAMEDVFAALWPIYDGPNWREQWCEGEFPGPPFWFSIEIASFAGDIHFYLRIPGGTRRLFESVIYANYPDMEIFESKDYTKMVPQDLPNKEYDLYGEDYVFMTKDSYPIKTYKFFEIRPEETEAEKRLDPIFSLLEGMSKLKKGEQFWFQIVASPITNNDKPWVDEGKALIDQLVHREGKPKVPSIIGETWRFIAHNKTPFEQEEKKEQGAIPPEMKLTFGEREVVSGIEEKISKLGFKTWIRCVYLYEKNALDPAHKKLSRAYFLHFAAQNMNGIRFTGDTRTKIHYFFRDRRLYQRKKKIFSKYIRRFHPHYPDLWKGTMIMNTEELASIFHFPISMVGLPSNIPRIVSRKGVSPLEVPSEDSTQEQEQK